jgi:hypothetical protein
MKVTKRQLRRIIKEERTRLLAEAPETGSAEHILDVTMTALESQLYGKFPDEEVDAFAVEAMAIVGGIEDLLAKLIGGGYREDY